MQLKKKILYFSAFILTVIYLVWRGLYTLPWEGSIFALVFGILLWLSEILSNFTAVILIWSKNSSKEISSRMFRRNYFLMSMSSSLLITKRSRYY